MAQQLEHLARSNQLMVSVIEETVAEGNVAGPKRPSLVGRLVLSTGWIPRGRGKAPERTRPRGLAGSELAGLVIDAGRRVDRLEARLNEIERASGRRPHFAFGGLTAGQWLRVIEVHTRHHLRIIDDILAGAGGERAQS